MTYDEYRRHAEASEFRHEYVGGVVYAMSGGTSAHGAIALNIGARLWALVRGTGCRAYSSTYHVRTPGGNEYSPDAFVACGPRHDDAGFSETPCVVVEVLSPGTARVDLNEKRTAYQEIATLGAYLVVEAEWRAVYRHWRGEDGAWRHETFAGDGAVPLPCPAGGVLTLADVYEGMDLPMAPPAPRLRRVREAAPV